MNKSLRRISAFLSPSWEISKSSNVSLVNIDVSQPEPWIPIDGDSGEIITIPSTTVYRNWAFACWANDITELFSSYRYTPSGYGLIFGCTGNDIYTGIDSDNRSYEQLTKTGVLSGVSSPFHICITQEYTVGSRFYLNGVELSPPIGSTNYDNVEGNPTWHIGMRANGTFTFSNTLQGIGFWTSTLSSGQVSSLASSTAVNPNTVGSPYFWVHVG